MEFKGNNLFSYDEIVEGYNASIGSRADFIDNMYDMYGQQMMSDEKTQEEFVNGVADIADRIEHGEFEMCFKSDDGFYGKEIVLKNLPENPLTQAAYENNLGYDGISEIEVYVPAKVSFDKGAAYNNLVVSEVVLKDSNSENIIKFDRPFEISRHDFTPVKESEVPQSVHEIKSPAVMKESWKDINYDIYELNDFISNFDLGISEMKDVKQFFEDNGINATFKTSNDGKIQIEAQTRQFPEAVTFIELNSDNWKSFSDDLHIAVSDFNMMDEYPNKAELLSSISDRISVFNSDTYDYEKASISHYENGAEISNEDFIKRFDEAIGKTESRTAEIDML